MMYEIWIHNADGWWPTERMTQSQSDNLAAGLKSHDDRPFVVVPAPVMTAQAWVEMGEV